MATTFMNLNLPIPTVTLSPTWASELNSAIETIDSHDHTSGKGTKIPTAGININENLDFNSYKIFDLKQTQYYNNLATLTGASNAGSIYMYSGDLYFTNNSGIAVQITSGGLLNSTPGAAQSFEITDVSSNLTILNTDTFVVMRINTSASRTLTLPEANSVVAGRVYTFKDITGSAYTNNITINRTNTDLIDSATSIVVDSDYGSITLVSDGVSNWNKI